MNTLPRFFYLGPECAEAFNLGNCETCNGLTREAAFAVRHDAKEVLLRAGLKELNFLPPESYYSERQDSEVCENCDQENKSQNPRHPEEEAVLEGIDLRLKSIGLSQKNRAFVKYILRYFLHEQTK